jgi:hypothetical protein
VRRDPRNNETRTFPDIRTEHTKITAPGHPQKVGGARTGNLGRAQGRDVTQNVDSVIATLGFDSSIAPYAPWVVGADYPGEDVDGEIMYQAQIHADRWWQFGSIISGEMENAWKLFDETFWEEFSKRIDKEK